ncbi:hypothetical protein AZ34_10330 [Hylemonella gracilis str. Niagara R]|uniref:Uncharacterized protein n=1 Tax=Hylemonella gracilis str. Niagara R TaxID=1458275 RepID=A0A016XLT2_9BURK|nr:hypothetical protein [Hylemonella gracilis]EYC52865.1 hypothetical protein AZ34_10330 [Hylemonella gracilis str. Niagara R]
MTDVIKVKTGALLISPLKEGDGVLLTVRGKAQGQAEPGSMTVHVDMPHLGLLLASLEAAAEQAGALQTSTDSLAAVGLSVVPMVREGGPR